MDRFDIEPWLFLYAQPLDPLGPFIRKGLHQIESL